MSVRTRIAPTPSGFLHIGNAFDFIFTWLLARKNAGHLLLRIDDLDVPRVRDEYLKEIFDALEWLELDYNEGPQNVSEIKESWSQQLRLPRYHKLLDRLAENGSVYACACSRKELEDKGPLLCPCAVRGYNLKEANVAWRFQTKPSDVVTVPDIKRGLQEVSVHTVNPNFVVRRKDGLPAYQITSLADDEAWEMNLIVRGEDLWESSALQLLLAERLELTHFKKSRFYHHPLIRTRSGAKLSKSAGDTSLKTLREKGHSPADIYQEFCSWNAYPFRAESASQLLNFLKDQSDGQTII